MQKINPVWFEGEVPPCPLTALLPEAMDPVRAEA